MIDEPAEARVDRIGSNEYPLGGQLVAIDQPSAGELGRYEQQRSVPHAVIDRGAHSDAKASGQPRIAVWVEGGQVVDHDDARSSRQRLGVLHEQRVGLHLAGASRQIDGDPAYGRVR